MTTLLHAALLAAALAPFPLQAAPVPGQTQGDTVRYEVSFPNAVHHEAEIVVTYTSLAQQPLEVRMSRTSPGRYALHEFAKNVYNVRAVDSRGRLLTVTRPNPHQWDVAGHDGTVRISYTLFADRADGTYSGIDNSHAHLNMPATFMWARGTGDRPIAITFHTPEASGWRIATQLPQRGGGGNSFVAPDLQYFMDSPTELSAFDAREWTVTSGDRTQTVRIAMHHLGTAAQLEEYAEHTRRIVQEQAAVFGELPEFDYGRYTFMADYLPWVAGDGMEHRNSTILTSTGSLQNMLGLLGTVSHEFFHAWNVERLRPATLEPFDFEEANMSDALWFAEGFTSYYGPLTMRRADVTTDAQYAGSLSGMLNTVINSPGRRYFTPVEMSMQAPFVDAATSVDPNNRANTFISYYTWGAAIGLGLDLTLRTRFDLTLDDYMRALWQKYGRHQDGHTPVRPYTVDDLRLTLGEVTGDTSFANTFFQRHVRGSEVVDYRTLLARAGILLGPARPGAASIGSTSLVSRDDALFVAGPVLVGTPLYDAGVTTGARIISLDGQPMAGPAELQEIVAAKRAGEPLAIEFEQRGERRSARVQLMEDPTLRVQLYEEADMPVTDAMRAFRAAWLGSRAR